MAKTKTCEQIQKLLEIGTDVASLWGAECYDVEIDKKEKSVTFMCIEAGEEFVTEMSFDEIKEEYGYEVK